MSETCVHNVYEPCGACHDQDRADARCERRIQAMYECCVARMANDQFESLRATDQLPDNKDQSHIDTLKDCIGDAVLSLRAAQRAVKEERDG